MSIAINHSHCNASSPFNSKLKEQKRWGKTYSCRQLNYDSDNSSEGKKAAIVVT